jgi:EAL domain-containing protein (putative c-di-GMP-specific phosphodiesterase class I)
METGIFMGPPDLPEQFVQCSEEFEELLRDRLVLPVYQPIITSATGVIRGYELLGRGNHPGLPSEPGKLFNIAERLGKEVELSMIFRETGILVARDLPSGVELFFNEHPSELNRPETIGFLKELRALAPDLPLVLEVNEKTVTDRQVVRELRAALNDLQIGLAYDDFGAGQARLLELIEVPPDYLKFDAFLIRDLHRQPHRFQRALATLVEMSVDLGVVPLAEGVETDEEAAACDALGFQALQGFLFGRPSPITELSDTPDL